MSEEIGDIRWHVVRLWAVILALLVSLAAAEHYGPDIAPLTCRAELWLVVRAWSKGR
jgi:hypothetical protein